MKIFFLVVVLYLVSVFQCNALLEGLYGGGGREEWGGTLFGEQSKLKSLLGGVLGKS